MASNDSMMSVPSVEIIPSISFRKSLLFYLKTNAKPRLSIKLMQISTYFCFKEFPCMAVKDLRYVNGEWEYLQLGESQAGYKTLDFDNLTKPLWITNALSLCDRNNENHLSRLLSKTAICDVTKLNIIGQHLKMNEFHFLISSNVVEDVQFLGTQVFYDDGSIVFVEEIVKLLPKLKKFAWAFTADPSEITPTSTKKLIEYLNPSILTHLALLKIPRSFDFKLFAEFMNKNPSISYFLAGVDVSGGLEIPYIPQACMD